MKQAVVQTVLAITIMITLTVGQPVSADAQYVIKDLGTLGGTLSNARAINAHMQIVGGSDTASGKTHAFLWQNEQMNDLGTLGGMNSSAAAINNAGQIVGMSQVSSGKFHAFLWENGIMKDLGTLGGQSSYANSINDAGQIVGKSHTTSGETHAFLWDGGIMTDLGTLGGSYSQANAINNHGQVVGFSYTASGESRAFLWENEVMTDLGTLPGGWSSGADDINDYQQIVGSSDTSSGETHAVLWADGAITDLGALEDTDNFSQAIAINDQLQIAGSSGNIANWNADRAVLWEDGMLVDLGTLGGNFATAFDINSGGQIVGFSSTLTGEQHATLWTISPILNIPSLDTFDRPNGPLGSNWMGYKNAFQILENQVDVRRNGSLYWKNAFGANQQVAVTLTKVDTDGYEQDLLLKVQGQYGPNWGEGVIEVLYDAATKTATVWTFLPETLDWYSYPAISITMKDGDQFGAQALATGQVVIFKNGMEAGRVTLNAADQAFFNPKGGHIGIWFINSQEAFIDDFSGGDIILP